MESLERTMCQREGIMQSILRLGLKEKINYQELTSGKVLNGIFSKIPYRKEKSNLIHGYDGIARRINKSLLI